MKSKLIGKTVYIQTSLDEYPWQCTITGIVKEIDRYLYSVRTEDGSRFLIDPYSVVIIKHPKKAKLIPINKKRPKLVK